MIFKIGERYSISEEIEKDAPLLCITGTLVYICQRLEPLSGMYNLKFHLDGEPANENCDITLKFGDESIYMCMSSFGLSEFAICNFRKIKLKQIR